MGDENDHQGSGWGDRLDGCVGILGSFGYITAVAIAIATKRFLHTTMVRSRLEPLLSVAISVAYQIIVAICS